MHVINCKDCGIDSTEHYKEKVELMRKSNGL
jgi:hypothetical protein